MSNTLVLHQTQVIRADGRLRLATFTAWGLFVVALLNGCFFYTQQSASRNAAQKASYEQWLNQPTKNPHSAAHYGFYAYKPVSVLTVMDKGLEDYLGAAVWLEAHNQNEVKVRAIQDAPYLARFADLTVGFVWQILFPLLIILLSFNAITAEREQGTLRMLVGAGVSKLDLLKAKTAAVYRLVMMIFLPTFLVLNGLMLALNPSNYAANLPHLLVFLLFQSIFYAFFTLVGVSVSALSKSSGYALFSLLSLWILASFIVPRVNALVAQKAFPTTTAFDFSKDMKRDLTEGSKERAKALETEYLTKYKVDSVKNLPINFVGVQLQDGEKHGDEVHEKHYGNLFAMLEKQDKVIEMGAILSPVTAIRNISMAVAGTDTDKEIDFTHQAETHRRTLQKTMNEAIIDAPKDTTGKIPMAKTSLWQKVQPFEYRAASIFQVIGNQALSILVLLGWTALGWFLLKKISDSITV